MIDRDLIRRRAERRCEYCLDHERSSLAAFHVEHIKARQHGGSDDESNLALACPDCNRLKGPNLSACDPQSDEQVNLFHPRIDRWSDHFRLDGARIEGATAIGRATVALLRMNAPARVQHRALWQKLSL